MIAISIRELHEHTEDWVRRATVEESIILEDNGRPVARIVSIAVAPVENPFYQRKLLPGFTELQAQLRGGTDSTGIISQMRDGR